MSLITNGSEIKVHFMENFRQVLYVNVYLAQEFLSLDLFTIQTDPKHGTYKFMIWMQYDAIINQSFH